MRRFPSPSASHTFGSIVIASTLEPRDLLARSTTRVVILAACLHLVLACSGDGRDIREGAEHGASAGTQHGSTSGWQDDSGDSEGEHTGSSSDSSDDLRFDVGTGDTEGDGHTPLSCQEAAAQQTNQGCEFWAVDLPMTWWAENNSPRAPQDGQFAVVVANASSNQPARVEVFRGNETVAIDSALVQTADVHVFPLPALNIDPRRSSTDGLAYRIESDAPVTAYQFNTLEQSTARYSADASLLFPTHVLREDYSAITGDAGFHNNQHIGAFVSVVGVHDGTVVDLFPTAPLQPGAPGSGVTIGRGQVYTVLSESLGQSTPTPREGNLSGSRVVASQPVAVFAGNVGAREPVINPRCCADHLEHQMLPLVSWGTRYLAAPPIDANETSMTARSTFRIVGAIDGTTLAYSPAPPAGAPTRIDAGEMAYLVTDQPFTITGSHPFGIAQFLISVRASSSTGVMGDPAMIVLPAQDQLQNGYVFLTPPTYRLNFVTVIRPVGSSVTLDGAVVSASATAVGTLDGTSYEYVSVPVQEGPHRIVGDQPFALNAYGYDEQISYAYPAGSGIARITEPPPPPQG